MRVATLLTLLFVAPLCLAEDRADQAIEDALLLLQGRRAKLIERAELEKLDRAIDRLKALSERKSDAPVESRRITTEEPAAAADKKPTLDVPIANFIDHTDRYKGQVVTLPLIIRSRALVPPGQSLRDLRGGSAQFMGLSEDGNRLNVLVELPRSLDIPKAGFGDRVVVSFRCSEGDLMRGNVATSIRRPGEPLSSPQD